MSTIFELENEFKAIDELDIDDETKRDTLESIDWEDNFVKKVESWTKVIKNAEANAQAKKAMAKELIEEANKQVKKANRMKDILKSVMLSTGNDRVQTELFRLAVQNTKARVVVDEDHLPKKYFVEKVVSKPDKVAIYDLLKAGEVIEGAHLEKNQTLRIK